MIAVFITEMVILFKHIIITIITVARRYNFAIVIKVPNVRNKRLNQGHFWTFASRQLVGVIVCLISSFQLNLANNYYFQEKLDLFTYKYV